MRLSAIFKRSYDQAEIGFARPQRELIGPRNIKEGGNVKRLLSDMLISRLVRGLCGVDVSLTKGVVDIVKTAYQLTIRRMAKPKRNRRKFVKDMAWKRDQPDRASVQINSSFCKFCFRPGS